MPQNTIKCNNMTLKLTIGHQIDILFRRKKEETPEKGVLPQGSAVDAQVVMGTVVFSLYLSLCGRLVYGTCCFMVKCFPTHTRCDIVFQTLPCGLKSGL